jgi:hypothetical protein
MWPKRWATWPVAVFLGGGNVVILLGWKLRVGCVDDVGSQKDKACCELKLPVAHNKKRQLCASSPFKMWMG